jgi:hypothetical protein
MHLLYIWYKLERTMGCASKDLNQFNVDYMKPLDLLLPSRVARVIQGEAVIISELLLIWTR